MPELIQYYADWGQFDLSIRYLRRHNELAYFYALLIMVCETI